MSTCPVAKQLPLVLESSANQRIKCLQFKTWFICQNAVPLGDIFPLREAQRFSSLQVRQKKIAHWAMVHVFARAFGFGGTCFCNQLSPVWKGFFHYLFSGQTGFSSVLVFEDCMEAQEGKGRLAWRPSSLVHSIQYQGPAQVLMLRPFLFLPIAIPMPSTVCLLLLC